MTIRESFGILSLVTNKTFTAGLECEIEHISDYALPNGWQASDDGSLRNNGVEFISSPSNREKLIEEFSALHKNIEYKKSRFFDPFSERTSVHVHVNCLDLTKSQVKNIVLLYCLFEPFFFELADKKRANNIHCVPLSETYLPTYLRFSLEKLMGTWSKYTALNLCRLGDLGTLEFRHMPGTSDVSLIEQWICVLENLWVAGQTHMLSPKTLSDENMIKTLFSKVFAGCPKILENKDTLLSQIENNLIDVKLSFV